MKQERMSLADFKVLTGKSTGRGTKETRSKEKETLGRWLLYSEWKWQREYRFDPDRKFRADWCLSELRILVEYEGGVFQQGKSHSNGVDYTDDCEKYAIANILGYIVIRVTAPMVRNGLVFTLIQRAIEAREAVK